MHVVDEASFQKALKNKGYRSLGQLAKAVGLHRNTLHYYLSGKPVYPKALEDLFQALDIEPSDVVVKQPKPATPPTESIAPLVDTLHAAFPDVSFVLFGSRARKKSHRYSDYDVGVYSQAGLPHNRFQKIYGRADDLAEDLPFHVDIVNLNAADPLFLKKISQDWFFLTGWQKDWIDLQKKASA